MLQRVRQRLVFALGITVTSAASYFAGTVSTASATAAPVAGATIATAVQGGGGDICWHTQLSNYQCPDSTWRLTGVSGAAGAALVVVAANGQIRSIPIPRDVDAIFLSSQAVQNFLLRYYAATGTPNAQKAVEIRAFLSRIRPR